MSPSLPSVFFSAFILCAAVPPPQQRPDAPERPPPAIAGLFLRPCGAGSCRASGAHWPRGWRRRSFISATRDANRHLVVVSDGVAPAGRGPALSAALKELAAADVTVHVISYTALGRAAPGPKLTRKRERGPLPEEGVMSLPRTRRRENPAPDLRDINEAKGGRVVDLDRLFGRGLPPRGELERREAEFEQLTEETGGTLSLPTTAAELLAQAAGVAGEVDAHYVVTYKPSRPVADARPGEYRKLDVIPRRLGLAVRTRRGYFVKK